MFFKSQNSLIPTPLFLPFATISIVFLVEKATDKFKLFTISSFASNSLLTSLFIKDTME